jgi:hypothetical protein
MVLKGQLMENITIKPFGTNGLDIALKYIQEQAALSPPSFNKW